MIVSARCPMDGHKSVNGTSSFRGQRKSKFEIISDIKNNKVNMLNIMDRHAKVFYIDLII